MRWLKTAIFAALFAAVPLFAYTAPSYAGNGGDDGGYDGGGGGYNHDWGGDGGGHDWNGGGHDYGSNDCAPEESPPPTEAAGPPPPDHNVPGLTNNCNSCTGGWGLYLKAHPGAQTPPFFVKVCQDVVYPWALTVGWKGNKCDPAMFDPPEKGKQPELWAAAVLLAKPAKPADATPITIPVPRPKPVIAVAVASSGPPVLPTDDAIDIRPPKVQMWIAPKSVLPAH